MELPISITQSGFPIGRGGAAWPGTYFHHPTLTPSLPSRIEARPPGLFTRQCVPNPAAENGFVPAPGVENGFVRVPGVENGFVPSPVAENGFVRARAENGFVRAPVVENGLVRTPIVEKWVGSEPTRLDRTWALPR